MLLLFFFCPFFFHLRRMLGEGEGKGTVPAKHQSLILSTPCPTHPFSSLPPLPPREVTFTQPQRTTTHCNNWGRIEESNQECTGGREQGRGKVGEGERERETRSEI